MPDTDALALLNTHPTAALRVGAARKITYCNPATERLLGWSAGDLLGKPLTVVFGPEHRELHLTWFNTALSAQERSRLGDSVPAQARHRDGHGIDVSVSVIPTAAEAGASLLLVLEDRRPKTELARQIAFTAQLRSASRLAAGVARKRGEAPAQVVEWLVTELQVADAELWLAGTADERPRRVAAVRRAEMDGAEVPGILNPRCTECVPEPVTRLLSTVAETVAPAECGEQIAAPFGFVGEIRGVLLCSADENSDPSAREIVHELAALLHPDEGWEVPAISKPAEAAARPDETGMPAASAATADDAAVANLAGGVAHELNNMLAVVNGYSELILAQTPADDPRQPAVKRILTAGERAATFTRQLLAYSRGQVLRPHRIDLCATLKSLQKRLCEAAGPDVAVQLQLPRRHQHARVDPDAFELMLVDLTVFARTRMPEGGSLTFRVVEAPAPSLEGPCARAGSRLALEVSDTGEALDEAFLADLREPFSGDRFPKTQIRLDFASAYGMVRQSGGDIRLSEAAEKRMVLAVYLPAGSGEGDSPSS